METIMFVRILFFTFVIFLTLNSHHAHALSCVMPDIQRSASSADKIFTGRVLKIERVQSEQHINKVTILVETPISNATKKEKVTVYQRHWLKTEEPWEESFLDKRNGLFTLQKNNSTALNLGDDLPEEIYFVGMCGTLVWADNKENSTLIKEALGQNKIGAE